MRAVYNSVVSTMSLVTTYGSRLEAGRRSCEQAAPPISIGSHMMSTDEWTYAQFWHRCQRVVLQNYNQNDDEARQQEHGADLIVAALLDGH